MITEDGSGLPLADSYATIAEADAYHEVRENDAWEPASVKMKSSALIRATDYIEAYFRANGEPLTLSQNLQWPRLGDYGLDPRVKRATIVLAFDALAGGLDVKPERTIKSTKESLEGVGLTETVYDDVKAPDEPFPAITAMLAAIASQRGSTSGVGFGRVIR